ncbi:hypothetical protein ASPCADRAFT_135706 [Aspergillus carbonarius ITEM 5010]|uniref:Uncharacterized protein n=1 Tax=Aspergillus carbonarius (strain ITEM 5010) TaxID=602072 RepID=A0A1R3R5L1_ASPC5|nr:hypothetical protein ASPCADRAFT_135706 [Aspergillus carbonarius ITEM 5010]
MSNCCSHGTFPHFSPQKFSFEYLLLPPRSALEARSTRDHSQGFVTDLHACLLVGASFLPRRRADSDFHGHRRAV